MFTISTLITVSVLAVDIRIDQVLPENSIAVMSINDVSQFVQHFEEMGATEAICEVGKIFLAAKGTEVSEKCPLSEACNELKVSLGDDVNISIPSGHAGMGLYPVVDFEVGSVGIGALLMCEVGDSKVGELVQKAFENHAESLKVELETVDISGRDVWMVQNELDTLEEILPFPIDLSSLSQVYLANTDGYLLIGTEPDAFDSLFTLIDGEEIEDSLASNDEYRELVQRCGEGGDIFAVVLLTNLADAFLQMDTSGMGMMFLPTLKAAVGDIDGFAERVSLSPEEGIALRGKYAVLMQEGRNGLMGLVGNGEPRADIPSFVGDDTISYNQAQIDYSKVAPWIKQVILSNPMLAMQVTPESMEQIDTSVQMYTSALGQSTHIVSAGTMPFSVESFGYLVAVECTDEEQLSNVLGLMMPTIGGEPTDFLGNQIFSFDLGSSMMMPLPIDLSFSVAVGGGYVFAGTSNSVENALRTIANPKESKSTHGANSSIQLLEQDDVCGWGYGDPVKSMQIQNELSKSMSDSMFTQMEEFDPEMAEEMRAEMNQGVEMQDSLIKVMSAVLGPVSWTMSSEETGFTVEVVMLKSKDN
jgi:hypothetical protein